MITLVLILVGMLIILAANVAAPPPTPHPVTGIVTTDSGNGVPNGIPIVINNTNESDSLTTTQVFGPPGFGLYSTSLLAENNDTIIATAWNATHFGENSTNVSDTTTRLNIVLDTVRPPELNVTIVVPPNNSLYNVSDNFNITANITMHGGTIGFNCYINISFSNEASVNITPNPDFSNLYEAININDDEVITWNGTAQAVGVSNITVTAACSNSGRVFEARPSYQLDNITVQDVIPPVVSLISPANETLFNAVNNFSRITFSYNVTDLTPIANCSLFVNGTRNMTNHSVTRNIPQFFYQDAPVGTYNWSVSCLDNSTIPAHNEAGTDGREFSVLAALPPNITTVIGPNFLDLIAGTTALLQCNATITDPNNISDIKGVNVSFYQENGDFFATNDNNDHYTNASCVSLGNSSYQANYTCTMPVFYYANNGTWNCNVSATDRTNQSSFFSDPVEVNQLLAINISSSLIDYGVIGPGNSTIDTYNMTITNFGNIDFNISLDGYSQTDGDGLAMTCDDGTIPLSNHRYSVNSSHSYGEMTQLTDTPTQIANFSLVQRTDDAAFGLSRNSTYWRIGAPFGIQGSCNGTIIFRTSIGT